MPRAAYATRGTVLYFHPTMTKNTPCGVTKPSPTWRQQSIFDYPRSRTVFCVAVAAKRQLDWCAVSAFCRRAGIITLQTWAGCYVSVTAVQTNVPMPCTSAITGISPCKYTPIVRSGPDHNRLLIFIRRGLSQFRAGLPPGLSARIRTPSLISAIAIRGSSGFLLVFGCAGQIRTADL